MPEVESAISRVRLKRRPYTRWWNVMFAVLAVLGYVWQAFDIWSNLEFISQKSGLFWQVLYFLFATQTGANIIAVIFVVLFVGSLLFQFERRIELPPPSDPTPLALTTHSVAAPPTVLDINSEPEEKPNLVFKRPVHHYVHQKYGILHEGRDPENPRDNIVAVTLPIENEFSDQFKAIPVIGVTAQLLYQASDLESYQLNRGAWLGNGNRVGFAVNETEHLIVALIVENDPDFVIGIHKEYQHNNNSIEKISRLLRESSYRIRVRLISEQLGITYGEREYELEINQDPPIAVTLNPLIELSVGEIRERLERFLKEGNELLKDFPKQTERTESDDKKIDVFENQVARFLRRYPERFSVATFLSDIPTVTYSGGAIKWNWPSLNRLTTRIARIGDMVEKLR